MAVLDKKDVLFERNGEGFLLPQLVDVTGSDGKTQVRILPLTRGEFLEHGGVNNEGQTSKDLDKWIILNKLVEPKIEESEFNCLPAGTVQMLALTVLINSKVIATKTALGIKEESDIKKS